MRTPMLLALSATVIVSACERRAATPGTAADSTGASTDTVTADSTTGVSSMSTSKTAPKSPNDSIIGHDSAFGPIGSVDSTGKLVPLRPKRP